MIKSFVLSLSIAAVGASYAADWQHNHPQFDPTGKVTLGTLAGVTSQLSNVNQQGLQSSASPTILMVNFNDGATSFDFKYALSVVTTVDYFVTRDIYLISENAHLIVDEQSFLNRFTFTKKPFVNEFNLGLVKTRHTFISSALNFYTNNPPVLCDFPPYDGNYFNIEINGCNFALSRNSKNSRVKYELLSNSAYHWFAHAGEGQVSTHFLPKLTSTVSSIASLTQPGGAQRVFTYSNYSNTETYVNMGTRFMISPDTDVYLIQNPPSYSSGPFSSFPFQNTGIFQTTLIVTDDIFVSIPYQMILHFPSIGATQWRSPQFQISYLENIKPILPP